MRFTGKLALSAAVLSLIAAPLSAQRWKWDFGVNGGYSTLTNILGQDDTGLDDNSGGSRIKFAPGSLLGTQLTFWTGPKMALRANLRYGSRDIKGSDTPDDFDFVEDVNLWGATADLLFRFKAPADEFTKMEMLPYLALGIGGKWHNPGGDQFTCSDPQESKTWACAPFTTGIPGNPQTWAMGEQKVLAGLIGLGADWRLSRGFAIRTELTDQIFQPQVYKASPFTGATVNLTDGDENESKFVHEFGIQAGLHFLFGVPRPVAVAIVTPAPVEQQPVTPVQPVTPPTPRPTPPVTESVSVCVIDPTAPGGIRMETATYFVATRDTMLTVNGQQVLLRNAVGNVMVAQNADWYVKGSPLLVTVGNEKIEFHTTGSTRIVESADLAFLGTVNGLPIYADKDDVKDVRDEIDELNRAQRGADLGKILEEHKDLREELAKVRTFYVPFQPTGCVFQAVLQQEQVRKNKQQ